MTFENLNVAGISGFRTAGILRFRVDPVVKDRSPTAVWSSTGRGGRPRAIAFDALNRSLLVRFPGSAAALFEKIPQGYTNTRIELVLPYGDTELWPPGNSNFVLPDGYFYRTNWGVTELPQACAAR